MFFSGRDGERGFEQLKNVALRNPAVFGLQVHIDASPFTYHNRNINTVMRTLRAALSPNTQHYWDGKHDDIIQQLVTYYNHSYYRSIKITPYQMHNNEELEWKYLRKMTEKLNDVKRQQVTHCCQTEQ